MNRLIGLYRGYYAVIEGQHVGIARRYYATRLAWRTWIENVTPGQLHRRVAKLERCAYKLDEIIHSGTCQVSPHHQAEAKELLLDARIPRGTGD